MQSAAGLPAIYRALSLELVLQSNVAPPMFQCRLPMCGCRHINKSTKQNIEITLRAHRK